MFRYPDEYVADTATESHSASPTFFTVDAGVNSITVYNGARSIFNDSLVRYLKNISYTDKTIGYPQDAHFYSRIFRWQAYSSINSPELRNTNIILAARNQPLTYNFGVMDKEHDSVRIIPHLLRVANGRLFHPNYIYDVSQPQFTTAQQNYIKHALTDSSQNLPYAPGYSPAMPFGANSSYTLNSAMGEISFTPADTGIFLLAYRVEEYRAGKLLGDVMAYRIAFVKDSNAVLPQLSAPFNISAGAHWDAANQAFTICAGETLSYTVSATSTLSDANIIVSSNVGQSAVGATAGYSGQNTANATVTYTWTPTIADNGTHYIYTDAVDTACGPNHLPVHQSRGVKIHVVTTSSIDAAKDWVCKGESIVLYAGDGQFPTWGVLPGGDPYNPCAFYCDSILVHPTITTSYTLQNKYGVCPTVFDTFTVTVHQPFTITAPDTSFPGGIPGNYTLLATPTPPGSGYSYVWTPFNRVSNPYIANPKPIIWVNHNEYHITVTDSMGCFSVTDTVYVDANTAGVADVGQEQMMIRVYPNPTHGRLSITAAQAGTARLSTMDGRVLASYTVSQGTQELKLPAHLSGGTYLLRFEPQGSNHQVTVKLVYEP